MMSKGFLLAEIFKKNSLESVYAVQVLHKVGMLQSIQDNLFFILDKAVDFHQQNGEQLCLPPPQLSQR